MREIETMGSFAMVMSPGGRLTCCDTSEGQALRHIQDVGVLSAELPFEFRCSAKNRPWRCLTHYLS